MIRNEYFFLKLTSSILWFLAIFFIILNNTKYFWEVWPIISLLAILISFGLILFVIIYPLLLLYFFIQKKMFSNSFIPMGLIFLSGLQLVIFGHDLISWEQYIEEPAVILKAQAKFRGDRSLILLKDSLFIDRYYSIYRIDYAGKFYFNTDSIRFEYGDMIMINPPIDFAILEQECETSIYLNCFFKKSLESESYSQFLFDVVYIDSSYFSIVREPK